MFTIGGLLNATPYVAVTAAALFLYNVVVDNPRVADAARQGYVTEAQLAAVKAQRDELQRQRDAATRAAEAWRVQLERFQTDIDLREQALEDRIAEYEARPENVDRCSLSDSDLEFLRK